MQYILGADGKEYYVKITGSTGAVVEVATGKYYLVEATSPHKVKIKLKNTLIALGCVFDKETRTKEKTDGC
jgi:hypothetical protein